MKYIPLLLSASILLTACGGNSNDSSKPLTEGSYAVQTVAADYSGSAVVTGNILGDRSAGQTILASAQSDYTVNSYGKYLYHLGRYSIDTISRYDSTVSLENAEWQYSANEDGGANANPYKVIQTSADNAYVIRYGSDSIWQINPQATVAADFIKATIDLSAYNPDGTVKPGMADGVFYNGRLFVVMQRWGSNGSLQTAYVAVIDTTTNEEIDTDPATDGLQGIALNVTNPVAAEAYNGVLYVAGRGGYNADNGGLDSIDMTTYIDNNIVNSNTFASLNDEANNIYFHILDVALINDQTGYVLVNLEKGYGTLSSLVYPFNPASATTGDALALPALSGKELSDLAVDANDRLWVGVSDAAAPALVVVDTDTNTQSGDSISLELPPRRIEFLTLD